MSLFSCKHPFDKLYVVKEHTEEVVSGGFTKVTYYFYCVKCQTYIAQKHLKTTNGVTAWFKEKI